VRRKTVDEPEKPEAPRKTSFLSSLLYVLGFMLALALLAWAIAWLLHHH
jgi:hypothetical protein